MIRRLRTMWANLRSTPLVVDAPAGDLGSLDVRNGVRPGPFADWDETRPAGEIPPAAVTSILADLDRGCPVCSWVPPHPRFKVLNHLPNGAHYSRSMDHPDMPVYDREFPFASQVEADLARLTGGAL